MRLLPFALIAVSFFTESLVATSGNKHPSYEQEMKPAYSRPKLPNDPLKDPQSRSQMTKQESDMQQTLGDDLKKKEDRKSETSSFEGSYAPVP